MNEQQTMLAEMVDGLFAGLGPTATLVDHWAQVDELALSTLLLPEDSGGFGGTWQDALIVFRLAGYHALALPVPEAVIAARLAAGTGIDGRGTIASRTTGTQAGDRFTGTISGAVASQGASFIAAPAPDGAGGSILVTTADGQRTPAGEAAAANCAAMGLAQALDRGEAAYEVAAAKLRANRAVGIGTASAHQAHGAIGFTQEYALHPITRRLISARSEFGGDSYWAALLGARVTAAGADRFWADLTSLTDC